MMKPAGPVDFTAFIRSHEEAVFGKKRKLTGESYCTAYRKQIAALDMKMNEFLSKKDPRAGDLTFLLGLFAFSISQFSVRDHRQMLTDMPLTFMHYLKKVKKDEVYRS
ncbi:MAG: hypothetical protein ACLTDX_17925 [[Clostridium] innocuum]